MVGCFAPGCNHRSHSAKYTCSFTSFPSNQNLQKKWMTNIRRADRQPNKVSRLCSCHFPNADFSQLPSIFERNKDQILQFKSPEKKKRRKANPDANKSLRNANLTMSSPASITDMRQNLNSVADMDPAQVPLPVMHSPDTVNNAPGEVDSQILSPVISSSNIVIHNESDTQTSLPASLRSNIVDFDEGDTHTSTSAIVNSNIIVHNEDDTQTSLASLSSNIVVLDEGDTHTSPSAILDSNIIVHDEDDTQTSPPAIFSSNIVIAVHNEDDIQMPSLVEHSPNLASTTQNEANSETSLPVEQSCNITSSVQTELTFSPHKCILNPKVYESQIDLLQAEIKKLKEQNEQLRKKNFDFETISNDETLCLHYTGLCGKVVRILGELLKKVSEEDKVKTVDILNYNEQVLLMLIKLRRNLSHQDLAFRFNVSISTVHKVFVKTLTIVHFVLFVNFMDKIPSLKKNQMFLPNCFEQCKNCRFIVDCTEISCDVPKNMEKQRLTWSNYKYKNTIKFCISCAPNGAVTYCSPGYPGSTSDKAIVQHTQLLSQCQPGDMILADKGFLIADDLPAGVSVNLPPFLSAPQFTESEVFQCRNTARARVHIERINARLKNFLILRHIPRKLFLSCDKIVQVCCALINLQSPILSECKDFFENLKSST